MKKVSVVLTSIMFTASLAISSPVSAKQIDQQEKRPTSVDCPISSLSNCKENINISPAPIIVDGKKITKEDGLVEYEFSGDVSTEKTSQSMNGVEPKGWKPYYKTQVNWGASWVKNQEILYLKYRGTTQAGGNVYRGKRIIQTEIKYVRNSKQLSRAISNAVYRGNSWRPGKIGTASAWDTLNPKAPVTRFHYKYYSVNPGLVG